ncbi:hypothetical protein LAZ67_1004216 [Cordylochernes scorpioides]|uniref:HTH CENPB-type domain-containing protein n=1 Tax=Cordylochernes scorpioides TaxID=51811 RepID=A0ABY6K0X9_9ARAC|nr:hypothetical protein LAZ67_1004216 [Cordylochernes scorpioides]
MINNEAIQKQLVDNQVKMKNYYDRHTRPADPLSIKDRVWFRKDKRWIPGQLKNQANEPRSFYVKDQEGNEYRRNSIHIREDKRNETTHTDWEKPLELNQEQADLQDLEESPSQPTSSGQLSSPGSPENVTTTGPPESCTNGSPGNLITTRSVTSKIRAKFEIRVRVRFGSVEDINLSFIFITMDRKKVCKKSSAKKKMMSIELKREIIEKHEQGVRVVDLSRQYGRSTSTSCMSTTSTSMICSVLKRKESIKSVTPAKGLTIISKLRTSLHENMEKLLMVWVTEKQLQGDTLTQTIICEKARAIYGDLLKQTPQTSIDEASEESFKASRGWFENFKKRSGIHSIVRHGEAASSDMKAVEDYIKTFSDLIKAQGYISQQVFNCDETGLFWKKMPNRTYITAEEKMMPGHKPMKDRLTLALCANASGDCKIKPLLVYHLRGGGYFYK